MLISKSILLGNDHFTILKANAKLMQIYSGILTHNHPSTQNYPKETTLYSREQYIRSYR